VDPNEILTALLSPEGRADPYPLYAALHEHGEVIAQDAFALVPGYDAVNGVLRDPALRVLDAARYDELMPAWRDHPSLSADGILNLNPPQHGRVRGLISREFTQRRVAGLAQAVSAMTDRLLDDMADRGADGSPVEFMHDFAFLLPVTVICELIGIPEADRETFRPLARALVAALEPATMTEQQWAEADAAAVWLNEYFSDLAAERRALPRDDLISALVGIHDSADGRLSNSELQDNLGLLLVAGFETTANLLGNGLRIILDSPALGPQLASGELAVAGFVDEVLRYDSPVQVTSRRSAEPASVGGHPVPANYEILLFLAAANRDARRFPAPEVFQADRADGPPLSFGGGAHFCLGSALARLEAGLAFPKIVSRFPGITAAGEPVRKDGLVLRGFESMPVRVARLTS